jgi:hypothetical protein
MRIFPRRQFLKGLSAGWPAMVIAGCTPWLAGAAQTDSENPEHRFTSADEQFLDELERAGCLFFVEQADPRTGLVKDRNRADDPNDPRQVASIAATGFGLTAMCIGAERGWVPRANAQAQVLRTLQFLYNKLPQEHGFFFHFIDARTGERVWKCELSSIDTAILLCGVLTCRQFFADAELRRLARQIYERVDWPWLLDADQVLRHGWKPESGFLKARWDTYCELMMLYLLALGSPTHPIPPEAWHAWKRPSFEYAGIRYINPAAPLFVHQYSHAWFDFRHQRDRYADYFENSVQATRAHRLFCLDLRKRFPQFGEELWGISASDSAKGYVAWGGPPEHGPLDGTCVPCAAGGSIPFLPVETVRVLRAMRERFGSKIWRRYGFVDAFNPHTGWVAPDVIGIDVGITLLMAENARSGLVWKTFMRNAEARRGMELAGFGAA